VVRIALDRLPGSRRAPNGFVLHGRTRPCDCASRVDAHRACDGAVEFIGVANVIAAGRKAIADRVKYDRGGEVRDGVLGRRASWASCRRICLALPIFINRCGSRQKTAMARSGSRLLDVGWLSLRAKFERDRLVVPRILALARRKA
jgi:hypothetical protein